ncbi:MAG: ATP:cob(I)alamin adenosyltransferase, partial [Planctomycetota bacterium]
MVKITRVYTKQGDRGRTSLGDGSRTAKFDPRVEAYGEVDTANAAIG